MQIGRVNGSNPLFSATRLPALPQRQSILKLQDKFFDILKENTQVKSCKIFDIEHNKKVIKSVRRMPWLSEAMKDVVSCDKLRGGANYL